MAQSCARRLPGAELVRGWDHPGLKRRAAKVLRRTERFFFDGQLHIARMLRMLGSGMEVVDSRWLAAVYLLSASDIL